MSWESRYLPPDPTQWKGRTDIPAGSCFFQIIQSVDLLKNKPTATQHPTFGLIGFKCDEGIRRNGGRVGAAEGPEAIRQNLASLAVQKQNFACLDVGNIICPDGDLETSQTALAEVTSLLVKQHITPIILGGGHELAWGHYQGIADAFPKYNLGIVNFDAHFDMRADFVVWDIKEPAQLIYQVGGNVPVRIVRHKLAN